MEANTNTPATTPTPEAAHRERLESDPRLATAGWMLVNLCGFTTKEASRMIGCRADALGHVLLNATPSMQQFSRLPLAIALVELRKQQAMAPAAV